MATASAKLRSASCVATRAANALATWCDTFRHVRGAEVESCLGAWIAATHPKFGPGTAASFALIDQLDRTKVGAAIYRREALSRAMHRALGPRDLLCIPTAAAIAPLKGTADLDRHGSYYTRTISLTSLAGIARLPQLTMPVATVSGAPLGLSLLAAPHQDAWLLRLGTSLSSILNK